MLIQFIKDDETINIILVNENITANDLLKRVKSVRNLCKGIHQRNDSDPGCV